MKSPNPGINFLRSFSCFQPESSSRLVLHGNGQGLVILAPTFATTDSGPWGEDGSALCRDTEMCPLTQGIRRDHRKGLMA